MIEVLHLFPKLNSSLIDLLEGISPNQWHNATLCRKWDVKDIAAHLLDTALRRISSGRDGHFEEAPKLESYEDLIKFLNSLNALWVEAYKRISPAVLIEQLVVAQEEFYNYLLTLDLKAPALFPVSWAGEQESQMWFDIAREYTERWHHQQQIRLAIGAKSILDRDLYYPFLQISMLALPHHYRDKRAADGTVIRLKIVGDAGGSWAIMRGGHSWHFTDPERSASTEIYIDENVAWMLLSKSVEISEAQQYWQLAGDQELGVHALKMTSFMV